MDKAKFVEVAPLYYALAIIEHLRSSGPTSYRQEITSKYVIEESNDNDEVGLLAHTEIFDRATEWLVEQALVVEYKDDFGPTIIRLAEDWNARIQEFSEVPDHLFHRIEMARDRGGWLMTALWNVSETYDSLGMRREDFSESSNEWEPLPLDTSSEALKFAVKSLDETIEAVRMDNGYSATLPEEREYVLAGLRQASQTLKDGSSTSVGYLRKYAIEPLDRLIRRFKGTAISTLALLTREALGEFVKEVAKHLAKLLF